MPRPGTALERALPVRSHPEQTRAAPRRRPRAARGPRPAPGRRGRRRASGARARGTRASPATRTSERPASRDWISASERAARGPPRSPTRTPSSRPSRSAAHSLRGPPVYRTTTSGRYRNTNAATSTAIPISNGSSPGISDTISSASPTATTAPAIRPPPNKRVRLVELEPAPRCPSPRSRPPRRPG